MRNLLRVSLERLNRMPLRFKLMLFIGTFQAFVSVCQYLAVPAFIEQHELSALTRDIHSITEIVATNVAPALFFADSVSARESLVSLENLHTLCGVWVVDANGRMFASFSPSGQMAPPPPLPIGMSGVHDESGTYTLWHPITQNGRQIGSLGICVSLREILLAVQQARITAGVVSILLFVVGILFIGIVSSMFVAPLSTIAETAHAITAGDLTRRAVVRSNDEIADFARSFNTMVAQVEDTQRRMRYRLELERIIITAASKFIDCPVTDIDRSLESSLRDVCAFIGVNRAAVFLFEGDETTISNTHEWCAASVPPLRATLQKVSLEGFPRLQAIMEQKLVRMVSDTDTVTPLSSTEREALVSHSVKSLAILPLIREGKAIGFLEFDAIGISHTWIEEDIQALELFVRNIVSALQRKAIEQALHESEQRYRQLFDNVPVGIYRTTPEGRILMANPRLCQMLGFTSVEDLTDANIGEKFFDTAAEREAFVQRMERDGEAHGIESAWKQKGGNRIIVRESARSVRAANNDSTVYEGTVEDVTESRRAGHELQVRAAADELIASVSARFMKMQSVNFADATRETLKEIGTFLGCDRSMVVRVKNQVGPDLEVIEWHDEHLQPIGGDTLRLINEVYPLLITRLRGFETVFIPDVYADTSYGIVETEVFRRFNIRSLIVVPMVFNNQLVGVVGFATTHAEFASSAVHISSLRLLGEVLVSANERMIAERHIRDSLAEKEVLLKEIHHRVKNNMQVISSLLSLQAHYVHDKADVTLLQESQARVKTMALIHERLYRSENLANIDFGAYALMLSNDLLRAYSARGVTLDINMSGISLDIERAIPCGLILNELVSNSLKYAFPEGNGGRIFATMQRNDGGKTFSYLIGDNGKGFPESIDFRTTESLGMQLVVTLTEQLGGTINLTKERGTEFCITFPVEG